MSTVASTLPLFGRKYRLTVSSLSGTNVSTKISYDGGTIPGISGGTNQVNENYVVLSEDTWEPEALRFKFDVYQTSYPSAWWYADIRIYNLTPQYIVGIVQQARVGNATVTLEAGYQAGNHYGIIWEGSILQTMLNRESGVDTVLTLRCVAAMTDEVMLDANNQPPSPLEGGCSQWDVVQHIAKYAGLQVRCNANDIAALSQVKLPRGGSFFGAPAKYFGQITSAHNMTYAVQPGNVLDLGSLNPPTGQPSVIYMPPRPPGSATGQDISQPDPPNASRTLLATPQQTEHGVNVRVLLDARMKVQISAPVVIQLDQTLIEQLPVTIGSYPAYLSPDGIYKVAGVRHVGDTRGNEWYSELDCWSLTNNILQMLEGGVDLYGNG